MASSLWGRFNHDFNFSLAVFPAWALRLHGGLTQTYSRTLPPNPHSRRRANPTVNVALKGLVACGGTHRRRQRRK